MAKDPTKKSPRQDLVVVNPATVQIPLPLLEVLEDAQSAFFGLCVETGKQVLAAMMEQDRTALCGPAGRHDPEREALRAGSTESAIVLGGRRIGMRRSACSGQCGTRRSLLSMSGRRRGGTMSRIWS